MLDQRVPCVALADRQADARATALRLEGRAVIAVDEHLQRARRRRTARSRCACRHATRLLHDGRVLHTCPAEGQPRSRACHNRSTTSSWVPGRRDACWPTGSRRTRATRVLLIEAGGRDRSPNIKIPAAFAKQFHTKLDWDFSTEPEPHVDGRSLYVPRGKSLGGSSSMNAMLYVRGRPLDYDLWEAQGAAGWGWRDVLPYFLKSEDDVRGASEFHGAGGPLRVSNQRSPRAEVDRRLIAASEAAGIPRSCDYNGPEQDGVAMFQVNQRDGRRWSAADAFLRPALKRPNLEVMTRTRVLRVEFEGDRAVGVRIASRAWTRALDPGRARGDPERGEHPVAAAVAPERHRLGRRPARGRRGRAPRPARSRAQPAGPPVRHAHLGGLRPRTPSTAPTSPSRSPSGCCAAPAR